MCRGTRGALEDLCIEKAKAVEASALADAGATPPVAAPRPDGARVQRAVVETHRPSASPFKAAAL